MLYKEIWQDLFLISEDYYFVQCISADFAMGKGIAVEFNKRFNTKNTLTDMFKSWVNYWDSYPENQGACLKAGKVFCLITKRNYYDKPTYITLGNALRDLKACLKKNPDIKKIAMPTIGCGLDRLKWEKVSEMIQDVFYDTDIEILVCKQN